MQLCFNAAGLSSTWTPSASHFLSVLQLELQADREVVVYDHSSSDPAALGPESFLGVLLVKLERSFPSVHLLSGECPCTSDSSLRHR